MKNFLPTCLLLLICFYARAQFTPANYIDSLTQSGVARQVKTADMNNDGMMDIVLHVNHFPTDSIRIYYANGNGTYSRQTIAEIQNTGRISQFDVADIDKDGWNDIAAITHNHTRLAWFKNTGSAFVHQPLASGLDFTTRVLIKDMDRNGLPDLLVLQHVEVVLYLQTSAGVFEAGRVVHSGTEFYAIDAAYYNQDSLPDIAVASGGFEVLLNEGNGRFRVHSAAGVQISFGLQSADLDNDGDTDIGMYQNLSGILFYKNDGAGNFSFADTLLKSTDIFETFGFADLDCDNDADLYTTIQQQGRVVWVENVQGVDFSQPKNIQVQPGELIRAIYASDMNSDGKSDIIWGNRHIGVNSNLAPCPMCIVNFTSNIQGVSYQWQADTGSGFIWLHNDPVYAGVNTARLQLTAPPTQWYGNRYRCIVNSTDTSEVVQLKFLVKWTGALDSAWENPANWGCGIMPDAYTDVVVEGDVPRWPHVSSEQYCRGLYLYAGAAIILSNSGILHVMGK